MGVSTSPNPPLSDRRFLKSETVRNMLGYSDAASFWSAVRKGGIPHVRINARRIMFDEQAVNAWLDARTVGKVSAT